MTTQELHAEKEKLQASISESKRILASSPNRKQKEYAEKFITRDTLALEEIEKQLILNDLQNL